MAKTITQVVDFKQYLKETDASHKVHKASDYVDDLKNRLRTKVKQKVTKLPWFGTDFEFRRGEVTLWCGQNGHGKSAMTSQVALSILGQQEKVCIASFEMKPEVTLQRMARMWVGVNPFSSEFQSEDGLKALDDLYEQFGEWTDLGMWMYEQTGTADPDQVLGMTKYCAKEPGVTHVFIDNLAKCIKSEDDYNGQKAFVDELTAIARDYKIHVHLVHHLKKPENEYKMPDKHDTKGSGAITDLVDNVMLVFRNKLKEEDRKQNGDFAKSKGDPDQFLLCRKQRNYEGNEEGEPTIKLWFSRDSQQYVVAPGERPMCFWNPWPHSAT